MQHSRETQQQAVQQDKHNDPCPNRRAPMVVGLWTQRTDWMWYNFYMQNPAKFFNKPSIGYERQQNNFSALGDSIQYYRGTTRRNNVIYTRYISVILE
jgi:hypothetical protein